MKNLISAHKNILIGLVLLLSAGIFLNRAWTAGALMREISKREARLHAKGPGDARRNLNNGSLLEEINKSARTAGVTRLLNVSMGSSDDKNQIQAEWEATPGAAVNFLRAFERCRNLRISANDRFLLRIKGSFGGFSGSVSASTAPVSALIVRNVFRPLWDPHQADPSAQQARLQKFQEEARRREQAETEKAQRDREESDRLQSKKRQLETELTLTGIVNNGREALALVNSRQGGGQTRMVHAGDVIQDARVIAIDEKRGEINLDYDGKFQVSLKLSSPSQENIQ